MLAATVCSDVQSAVLFDDRLPINEAVPSERAGIEKSWGEKREEVSITDSVPLAVISSEVYY